MVEVHEKAKDFIIKNELGLHLRPAGLLVKTANKYEADITVEKDGVQADGKSIIGITTLNATKNSKITIKACGKDADQALEELERLITGNFKET
ncbi:MAG: HPr family phosphocarrier protein [Deltaproteobacteria bacterium]|jgi:phosphocarrier protein|nr:HPr family phosphocarrier protein [Deltaproteobacteria bacterium]